MSSSSPPASPSVDVVVEEKKSSGGAASGAVIAGIALIPTIFTIVFHAGAAYLSYQRNQSLGWAILHFFLAVFYYPYYAFTQGGSSSVTPASTQSSILPTVQTAGRRLRGLIHGKRK